MIRDARKTLIYILSDVRSGSTMLDALLNQHRDIQSVGELRNFEPFLAGKGTGHSPNSRCSCRQSLRSCPLWSKVIARYEANGGHDASELRTLLDKDHNDRKRFLIALAGFLCCIPALRRVLLRRVLEGADVKNVGTNCFTLMRHVCAVTRKSVIVDSSKKAEHLYALLTAVPSDFRVKVIHLVRDGRAVTFSRLARAEQYGETVRCGSAVLGWVNANLMARNVLAFVPPEDCITIAYEDLCKDTEHAMRDVCASLGILFDGNLLRFSKEERHNIGGTSHSFTEATQIRLDQRWRESLGIKDRMTFALLGGWLNLLMRSR